MVCVSSTAESTPTKEVASGAGHSREVRDGEERVRVEDVGLEESLQQVPRHLGHSVSQPGGRLPGRATSWGVGGWRWRWWAMALAMAEGVREQHGPHLGAVRECDVDVEDVRGGGGPVVHGRRSRSRSRSGLSAQRDGRDQVSDSCRWPSQCQCNAWFARRTHRYVR